jgi:hypothetical protein
MVGRVSVRAHPSWRFYLLSARVAAWARASAVNRQIATADYHDAVRANALSVIFF